MANKRLSTMRHTTLRKDGIFFRLTKHWARGPLKPTEKQPNPDVARALLANFSGNPPYDMLAIQRLPMHTCLNSSKLGSLSTMCPWGMSSGISA